MVQQARYIPPVVVDSVKPEETIQLTTADQAQVEVQNEEVVEEVQVVAKEVQEDVDEAEPFYVVEEMPMFPGGDAAIQSIRSVFLKVLIPNSMLKL